MRMKKRSKRSRIRGTRLCGFAEKKHKGSGNRGGIGMSGSGKRGDQKKSWVIKYRFPYFGKIGFTKKGNSEKVTISVINLQDISKNLDNFVKYGKAKKGKDGYELNLESYKILGKGDLNEKMIIRALAFSESAKAKIEKAGGEAIVTKSEEKAEAVETKKEDKPAKKKETKAKK